MLKLFVLNLSKFLIACFILAAGVFGFLWLKNTEDEVSVEKLEETSFFVQTQSVVFNNYNPEKKAEALSWLRNALKYINKKQTEK